MPLPLSPQTSKPETENIQFSKIMPSDHDQSKKREENYQAKMSSSPQRTIKKRSAFDDLTNATQNQSVQLKKKASKEFVKYGSKNTYALGVAKNKGRKRKWCKLEAVPVTHSTTLVSNIIEKPLSLNISSKSETPPTEEAKNSFLFKEECAIKEPALIKKATKKYTNNAEMFLLEKLLSLKEETDNEFGTEPMIWGKKAKIEESLSTKKSLPLSKTTYAADIMNPLVLQNTVSKEKAFTMEPTEQYLLWKPPSLQEKHITEGSILQKPLALQKMSLEEYPICTVSPAFEMKSTTNGTALITEPLFLKKDYTTEKSTIEGKRSYSNKSLVVQEMESSLTIEEFQKPSLLQKQQTNQGQMCILKRPWSLEMNLSEKSNTCLKQTTYKKKHTTMKTTQTMPLPLVKRKKRNTWRKPGYIPLAIQEVTHADKIHTKEPMFGKSTTEDALFQKSFVFQGKYNNLEDKVTAEKTLYPQKFPTEKSYQQEALDLTRKCVLEEATPTKKPVPFKKPQPSTQDIVSYMKPILLPTTTFGENSCTQEPFSFKEEAMPLKNKMCTTQNMHSCQGLSEWKEEIAEEIHSFFMKSPLKKKPKIKEEVLFQDSVALKKNTTLQGMSLSKKPSPLPKTTTEEESHGKKPMVFLENPIIEKHFVQEPFSFSDKPDKEESCFLKAFNFQEKIDANNDFLKKQLDFQESPTIEDDLLLNKLLLWKNMPSAQAPISLEGQLSLNKPTFQEQILKKQLALCENIDDESLNEPLDLSISASIENLATQMKPCSLQKTSTEKKPLLQKPLILRKHSAIMKHAVMEHITDTEAQLKKPLTLEDKSNNEKEAPLEEPLALDKKPILENEDIFKNPLVFENSVSDKRVLFQEALVMSKKLASQKQSSLKQPLAVENNSTHEENTVFQELIPEVESSSCASNNDFSSKASIPDTVCMSDAAKPSTTGSTSACELNSQNKQTWQKKDELEATEGDNNDSFFNLEYAEDIFAYLKEREEHFILRNYMDKQTDLTSDMRALLVDWLVEVQINFEMSHETLYLAVKLVDHYLTTSLLKKENLQLLGSTAFFIAAKFEEPYPPSLKEFLYICEDLYQRNDMLTLEASILTNLDYDINIPIAYNFLRRYATCLQSSMTTLTLSRYICEITLQESYYIPERASKLAAGSFLLALCMKNLGHLISSLERHSGYKVSDLRCLVKKLNVLVARQPCNNFKTVYNKYCSQVYYEVAKIGPLKLSDLEEILHTD
ncbi:G2/mitotic-specific cyclin-B3 [Perognathus longimembris pacificus]|uniref:G2/mitotic-specific cyclin-B3 n=1 Tax=Perognathus longimembris pacificus TaxID=214514 RepID=UPI0020185BDC|nr:G2/mitotic-specific cyclin-B3 [Perognathus longimembris pacificus]